MLPAFAGLRTHRRAIDAGCKVAGATVHFVTAELDHGPMVAYAHARLAAKLSYTNIGFALAPREFALSTLRDIYGAALAGRADEAVADDKALGSALETQAARLRSALAAPSERMAYYALVAIGAVGLALGSLPGVMLAGLAIGLLGEARGLLGRGANRDGSVDELINYVPAADARHLRHRHALLHQIEQPV